MATNDNYVSSSKFADIVDDCLWYTFEFLSFKEKFGVMRVCKRWRKVTTEMIENGDCLELEMAPKLTSEINYREPDYSDEERFKRSCEEGIGKQVEIFSNYKMEYVENVSIKSHNSHSYIDPVNQLTLGTHHLTLGSILWLFNRLPHLKSLNFIDITILLPDDRCLEAGGPLSVLIKRLKSLRVQPFKDNIWLYSFFTGENVLEELYLKNGFFRSFRNRPKFTHLKRVRLEAANLQHVAYLIGRSSNLTDIRIKHLRRPKQRLIYNIPLYFARFTQLKTLKLGFVRGIDEPWDGPALQDILSQKGAGIKLFRFANLQHFKLSGVPIGHSMFGLILSQMPTIRSLKLRGVCVACTCLNKPCWKCPKLFFEKIASLKHLRELHLNCNTYMDFNLVFVDTLTRFVNEGVLPKLRKIRCTLANIFSQSMFLAFCNMARENSKEAFVMLAPFNDKNVIQNNRKLLSIKPRNLEAIHSCC